MHPVFVVLTVLSILLNLPVIHLGIIFLFNLRKRVPFAAAAPNTRFAVLVPARNEENVIANLIRAIRAQDYPADKIDVYVAVNHCTDATAELARREGARILNCSDGVRCKGDVLHEAIETLLPMPYDAYAIFDADNLPTPDFFQRMNDALAAGERVCRSRLKAGNATESWVSGCYGLYHALMEFAYSRPHTLAGFSSNLVGTAFVIHREVLERMNGWNTISICEDSEFAAQCSRMGVRVCFVPEALSYDEQVARFGTSLRQRRRWCYGMVQASRVMLGSMFSRRCVNRAMARDFGIILLMANTMPIAALIGAVAMCFQLPQALLMGIGGLALSWIGLTLAGWLMCRLGGYRTRDMIGAILLNPLFTFSWMPLQVMALFVPVRQWSYIAHNGQRIDR